MVIFLAVLNFVLFVSAIGLAVRVFRKGYLTRLGVVIVIWLLGVGTSITFVLYFFLNPRVYLLPSLVASLVATVFTGIPLLEEKLENEQYLPRKLS